MQLHAWCCRSKLYKYCTSFLGASIVKPRGLFLVMKEAVASKVVEQFNPLPAFRDIFYCPGVDISVRDLQLLQLTSPSRSYYSIQENCRWQNFKNKRRKIVSKKGKITVLPPTLNTTLKMSSSLELARQWHNCSLLHEPFHFKRTSVA